MLAYWAKSEEVNSKLATFEAAREARNRETDDIKERLRWLEQTGRDCDCRE